MAESSIFCSPIQPRIGLGKLLKRIGLNLLKQAIEFKFVGFIQGLALPTIQPMFARWSAPDERGVLIGLAFAGVTLGSSITFPLSGFLCQYGFAGGWPSIFYSSGSTT